MSRGNLQADIDRFGRMYVASSHVSRAVMRSRSREELLAEVARVLVEVGGFAMVSVRWHDPETQELVPVAEFGNGLDYVRSIRVFADERPEGLGPAGIAFRENRPYICNDCLTDASTLPWRRFIRTHGWHSYAAFPICIAGTPRGLLSIYTLDAGVFGPEQVELLGSVTSDIEFGLEHLAEEERRSHAEAALAESERRLNLALDAAGMGTFELDVATGKVIWDGRLVQILGFVPGGFEGTVAAFVRRVHPEDRARVLADLDHARDSHTSFAHEFRGLWPDGIERWTHSRGEYRYGNSGQPERLYGVATDITARKQAEAELRRNEERLQQAVRVSGIGIFDYDHATDTLFYSPRQREMIHFGPDEPVSMQIYFSLVHPDDLPRVHAAALRGHDPAGDGRFDVEHRALLRDGTIGWVSVRAQTFFEGEGAARHAVRTVGATREITAEVKAAEEQRRLASLVAMSRSFIATATLEGRVEYMNQAAMDVVGIESLEEARKKSIFEFCADSDHAFARDVVHPAVIKHGSWTGEARFRNFKTDTVVDVEMVIFVVRDESGVPLYLETVSQDITGRKRVEAEREKLREQLFQAQKMKSIGRLAGGVAHDFNNMLTVINGYTRILLDRLKPGDEMRLDLEEVSKAGVRAAALTEQLLAFSRMQVRQPRTLNLNRVVVQVQPMLERLLGEDVELNLLLHPEAAMVCADEHQLEQVVMNLVVNSRDAMPAGGTINIETAIVENVRLQTGTAARAGNSVVLKVHDTGVGMDEETRKHIFESFFTSKQVGQGTGLGLSVIQGDRGTERRLHRVHECARPGDHLLDLPAPCARRRSAGARAGNSAASLRDGDGADRGGHPGGAPVRGGCPRRLRLSRAAGAACRGGAGALRGAGERHRHGSDGCCDAEHERQGTRRPDQAALAQNETAFHVGLHRRCDAAPRDRARGDGAAPEALYSGTARPAGSPDSRRAGQPAPHRDRGRRSRCTPIPEAGAGIRRVRRD